MENLDNHKIGLKNGNINFNCPWGRGQKVVLLLILITFSSSLFSPVFAFYPSNNIKSFTNKNNLFNRANDKVYFAAINRYQPYFEVGGEKYFNQKAKVADIYDLFIPLWQQPLDKLIFTDLRIFDRSGSSFEGNAHFGYRKLYPDIKQMWGVYAAFDYRKSNVGNSFKQLTLGFEYWQNSWFIGGNIYKPLGETIKYIGENGIERRLEISSINIAEFELYKVTTTAITNKHREKILPGFDAELGYAFNDNFTGYVGGYYFHAADVNTIAGPKLRFNYNYQQPSGRILGVLDRLSIEVGVQHDKPRGAIAYIGIKFKVGLTNFERNSNISGFERHMIELVRRDPDIVVGKARPEKTELINESRYILFGEEHICLGDMVNKEAHNYLYKLIAMKAAEAVYAYSPKDKDAYSQHEILENMGFKLIDQDKRENNFHAKAYKMENGKNRMLLIAYSGMDLFKVHFKTLFDKANIAIRIFLGVNLEQQKAALEFATKVITVAGANAKILFAGHSLGCVLSQRAAMATGKDAIVFDCPRVKGPYGSSKIIFYNAPPNIINFNVDHLRDRQSDNLELITVYKKSGLCFDCHFPGNIAQHRIESFRNSYNLNGTLRAGYVELRTSYTPNIVELAAGIQGYHEQLRSKWFEQYKANHFDKNAIPGFPELAANVNFRNAFPTARSYINGFIKFQAKNKG